MPKYTPLQKIKSLMSRHEKEIWDACIKLREAQLSCQHKRVGEFDYKPGYFGNSIPPMRVCLDCGYKECGWRCGYNRLSDDSGRNVFPLKDEDAAAYNLPVSEEIMVHTRYSHGTVSVKE